MAVSLYSDVATKEHTPDPSNMLSPQRAGAKVYTVQAAIELAAAAADSEIAICRLRKGDEVLLNSFMSHDVLGVGTSMDIGDNDDTTAVDADRYVDGADTAAAADMIAFKDVGAAACIDKVPYTVQKDCWLIAKVLGAAATGTVKFTIFIARNGG
jgi:hypothetical protein